jgi:hypothetical protein
MPIARVTNFPRVAYSVLACAAVIYGSRPGFAQTLDLPSEPVQQAGPVSGPYPPANQASEDQDQPSSQSVECGIGHLGQCLKDIGHDQIGIWTSPLRMAPRDAIWLVPFAGATGVALHYDAEALQNLGIDKSRIDTSNTISAFGSPYATFGGAAGLYFLGLGTHNEHLAETGRLGAEAVADASIVVEALKLATNRERPNEGNGQGGFWPHSTRSYELDGSFPSGHAAATPTEGLQRRVNIQLIARCLTDAHVKECQGYLLRVYKKNDKSDWDPTAMNESHILDWSRHGTTPLTLKPGIDQRLDVCFIQSDFLRMIPAITRLPSIWRTVFDSNGTFRFDIKVIRTAHHLT